MGRGRADSGVPFGDGPFTQSDFDDIAKARANLVGISVAGLFAERPPYALDAAAQASLDEVIARVQKAGLFAVIEIRSGPGRNEDAITGREQATLYEPIWTDAAAQAAWVEMMRYIARRYGNVPTVVGFDPMEEPNNSERHGNLSPSEFYAQYGGTIEDVNQLYARVTRAIREVDPTTPVLLQPEHYGDVQWLSNLKITGDTATVYTVHDYEPFDYTHDLNAGPGYPGTYDLEHNGNPQLVDKAALSKHLQPVRDFASKNHVPIAISEFGVQRQVKGAAAYLTDRIELHNAIGSWAVWVWQPAGFADPFNMHDASAVHDVLVQAWRTNCSPPVK
jgi:aryl-phospho-beta-D-glucosidase BglC (GH1 family)